VASRRRPLAIAVLAGGVLAVGASAGAARTPSHQARAAAASASCLQVGLYSDQPARDLRHLGKTGRRVTTISVYLGPNERVSQSVLRYARGHHSRLLVTWQPDSGSTRASQPAYRLSKIRHGKLDQDLRGLARQLARARVPVIFRPMPEPNTPWYAWSGTVNGNTPADYVRTWRHVRAVVRGVAHGRVKLLWSPYAYSIPDTDPNALARYWPGRKSVDLVGVDAYNFGDRNGQAFTSPVDLFSAAYASVEKLAALPFWIAETGSAAQAGGQAQWIRQLGDLRATLPHLAGVVWYGVKDANGDFRLRSGSSKAAFRSIPGRRC
jgi:mannan endo-1,4-beta-mannosidase